MRGELSLAEERFLLNRLGGFYFLLSFSITKYHWWSCCHRSQWFRHCVICTGFEQKDSFLVPFLRPGVLLSV